MAFVVEQTANWFGLQQQPCGRGCEARNRVWRKDSSSYSTAFSFPTFSQTTFCRGRARCALRRAARASLCHASRLANVTLAVCTLGADNRAHDFAVQMRQHLQSFLTGSVAALAFGYYRVHQDVWYAAEAVQQRR